MFKALFGGLRNLLSWKPRAQDPPPNSSPTDSYLQKLITYIPADIVGAWVVLSGMLTQASATSPHWLNWAVFGGLLVLTPFYVCYLKTTPPGLTSNKIFHWSTACLAFVSWVFALGAPFNTLSWYQPIFGSVELVFVTLTIPILESFFVKGKGAGGGGGDNSGTGSGGNGSSGADTPSKK